jgi:hypothetical protein
LESFKVKSLRVMVIAAISAITLPGCVFEEPAKGALFVEKDNFYLEPKNIEEFIELTEDTPLHVCFMTTNLRMSLEPGLESKSR